MIKYYPIFDRVVVRQDAAEEMTDGGLYLPEKGKEKPLTGTVLAVGETVCSLMNKGDTVQFSKFGGTKVKMKEFHPEKKEEELIILKETECFGYFRDE